MAKALALLLIAVAAVTVVLLLSPYFLPHQTPAYLLPQPALSISVVAVRPDGSTFVIQGTTVTVNGIPISGISFLVHFTGSSAGYSQYNALPSSSWYQVSMVCRLVGGCSPAVTCGTDAHGSLASPNDWKSSFGTTAFAIGTQYNLGDYAGTGLVGGYVIQTTANWILAHADGFICPSAGTFSVVFSVTLVAQAIGAAPLPSPATYQGSATVTVVVS